VIIDPDDYEQRNFGGQQILPREIGKGKAAVLARKMRGINPRMKIDAIGAAVEDVPLGLLRADAILGCLDNRTARRFLNQAAQWLRAGCYIDAGAEPSAMLARVNVYRPGDDQPCLQCAWSDSDYARLETVYPCRRDANGGGGNNVPSVLGILAAGLQMIELEKVAAGRWENALVGRQVTFCAHPHKLHVTRFDRNPACRCEHAAWSISTLKSPDGCTIDDLLKTTGGETLTVEGNSLARTLVCEACGRRRRVLRLERRLERRQQICRHCKKRMISVGFDQIPTLSRENLARRERGATLRNVGFLSGDIIAIRIGDDLRRFELQLAQGEGV